MPRLPILFFLAVLAPAQQATYDLLLKGGHVIDPKNSVDAIRDVAIRGGKIAAVAPDLPASNARKTLDVSGLFVTPGLVDIHTHVFWGTKHGVTTNGDHCVQPDAVGFRTGVTTMVDAGSSGWRDFAEFRRRVIETSQTRVLAMINIVGVGMLGEDDAVDQNQFDMNPALVAETARKNADVIVAIKTAHWRQPNLIAVDKALEAAKLANLPVVVDFGYFDNKPYQVMINDKLRPGDVSTHFYRFPAPLLDKNGRVAEYLQLARKRGVKFDVGHGGGSFHFPLAEPMIKQGFWPDSISTDLHSGSLNGAMIDMLNVMSKILALGVPFPEVIRESTTNPAAEMRHPEIGQIGVGADADIAVLRLEHGRFGFVDVKGGRVEGTDRIGCEMTLRAGKIVFDFNGRAGVPWREGHLSYPVR
jgi:dihydroorotase